MMLYILQWSELWATLLPIFVWIVKKPDDALLNPLKLYLVIVLCLYICIFSAYFSIIENNHFFYTLVSICRLTCFSWFFARLNFQSSKKITWNIYLIAIVLLLLNFIFFENFFTAFSSNTFSAEAIVLLIFCIQYFLNKLQADAISTNFDAALYIVTGLAIYEAVCFPMFLFYNTLINSNELYAAHVWNIVQNINYILFCLFIAGAFYGTSKRVN